MSVELMSLRILRKYNMMSYLWQVIPIKPLHKVFHFKIISPSLYVSVSLPVFRNNSTHVWDIIQTIMVFHVNFDVEISQTENNPELIQNFVSPQPAPSPFPTPHQMPPPPNICFSRNTSLEDCWLALNLNPTEFIPTMKRTNTQDQHRGFNPVLEEGRLDLGEERGGLYLKIPLTTSPPRNLP